MVKVTKNLQITIPKQLAEEVGIAPGDEIELVAAGNTIRLLPMGTRSRLVKAERLRLFREATERQRLREQALTVTETNDDRGWTREQLYSRGHPR